MLWRFLQSFKYSRRRLPFSSHFYPSFKAVVLSTFSKRSKPSAIPAQFQSIPTQHSTFNMSHPSMLAKVEHCQKILGYQFRDQDLCWEALQMAGNGMRVAGSRLIPNGNKRLAIIGDLVIDLILSEAWYGRGELEGRFRALCRYLGRYTAFRADCIVAQVPGTISGSLLRQM